MKCRTFKAIREDLEKLPKVCNKESLFAALPVLVEAMTKIKTMRKTVKVVEAITKKVNDQASTYALEHESIFMGGKLVTDGKGIKRGTVEADGKLYHFAAGFDKPIRLDGDPLTQEFLSQLPKDFTKGKLELDYRDLTDDQLAKAGLIRSANNAWSVDADDAAEGGE